VSVELANLDIVTIVAIICYTVFRVAKLFTNSGGASC